MFRSFLCFLLLTVSAFAQMTGDQLDFQKAVSAPTDSARIALLDAYIAAHPASSMLANAHAAQFQAYANLKDDRAAFRALRRYLALVEPNQLPQTLNALAFEFAQRKYFIDSAAAFIDTAIAIYPREEPVLYNTKALVLLRQKRYAAAESLQQRVISLLPPDARLDSRYISFFLQRGFILIESGRAVDGIKDVMLGNLLIAKQNLPKEKVDSILMDHGVVASRVTMVRDSLYRIVVGEFLVTSSDTIRAKSNLAVGLARNNVLPDIALSFAKESYAAAQGRTIEDRSGAAAAMGLVLYNIGNIREAEQYLSDAAVFAAPVETELFSTLGDVKEQLGKKQEAFTAYVTASMGARSSALYPKIIALKNELYPTVNMDSIIVAAQASILQFTPEEYHRTEKRQWKPLQYDRVVLAELFTGAECKPCLAADIAFDYLIERFRTSSLAILQYHLHIPMPDPLANADGEQRAEYYGVRSTPTAVFGGSTIVTSGGNRMMAKNKFYLYSDIIERMAALPSPVLLTVSATASNGKVTVKGAVKAPAKSTSLRLRLVLAEEEVAYTGANGIEQHKFVVRKMITPDAGLPLLTNGSLTINSTADLKKLAADLQSYYDRTNRQYSEMGAALKENKSAVDPNKLAVVAFVQDDSTKEVLQAATVKVNVKPAKK